MLSANNVQQKKLNRRPRQALWGVTYKILGETVQIELRFKREAAQEMYALTKATNTTIMRLEEINFLITSTARLSVEDDTSTCKKKKPDKIIDVVCSHLHYFFFFMRFFFVL